MNPPTIPYAVLESAVESLKIQSVEVRKKKLDKFSISYEVMPLKQGHSFFPTLYKIKLVPEDLSYTFFGVWTETGQRITTNH